MDHLFVPRVFYQPSLGGHAGELWDILLESCWLPTKSTQIHRGFGNVTAKVESSGELASVHWLQFMDIAVFRFLTRRDLVALVIERMSRFRPCVGANPTYIEDALHLDQFLTFQTRVSNPNLKNLSQLRIISLWLPNVNLKIVSAITSWSWLSFSTATPYHLHWISSR